MDTVVQAIGNYEPIAPRDTLGYCTKANRGDLRQLAATLNNPLKRSPGAYTRAFFVSGNTKWHVLNSTHPISESSKNASSSTTALWARPSNVSTSRLRILAVRASKAATTTSSSLDPTSSNRSTNHSWKSASMS